MLVMDSKIPEMAVLSVRAGGAVAKISEVIVDPDTLKVIAFRCYGGMVPRNGADILSVSSVREFSRLGVVIDDIEELVSADEVVRIEKVLQLNFTLPGLKVETKSGHKLGKIADFTINIDDFLVMQIIVQRPVLKALMDPELTIHRKEIVEVTDYKVIVKSEEDTLKKKAGNEEFVPNFVNPFRNHEPGFSPSHKKSLGGRDKQ